MTPADIRRLSPTPHFYTKIDDTEIKLLSALLASRMARISQAVAKAAELKRLKEMMQRDIVNFTFDKVSGEERPAFGTRCPEVISRHGGDPQGGRRGPLTTFTYFDLARGDWRSFRPENFVRINDDYTL